MKTSGNDKPKLSNARRRGILWLACWLIWSLWTGVIAQEQARSALAQAGQATNTLPALALKVLGNPAGAGSLSPHLTQTPTGGQLVSWLEPAGAGELALRYAVRLDADWTAARTITTRPNFMKHPAELPVVAQLSAKNFVALWAQGKGTTKRGEDVYASGSRDGGVTWTTPVRVHRDDSEAEHGLVSLMPASASTAVLVWLDGAGGKTTALKQALFNADGSVSGESSLDDDVCSCCPTSILATPQGALLAYRDHAPDDIRDISFLRFRQGRWSAPQSLHADGWKISGCPTNSVQLAADGQRVAAAWFTAANNTPQVKVAFSNNAGESFGAPVLVNEKPALGRASVALLPDGKAVVAWAEKGESQTQLLVRLVAADGTLGPVAPLASGTKAFPRLLRAGNDVVVVWAEGTVKTALLRPNAASTGLKTPVSKD